MKSYIKIAVSGDIKMKMFAGLCSLFLPLCLFAQQTDKDSTLIRTVVVEQEYNPNVTDASKINILPEVEEPTVVKKDIEYSTTPIPATSYGAYQELLPFTQQDTQPNAKRGYARLGYGNRGNVDAKLSYLYDFSSKDRLGVDFSMDGRNEKRSAVPPYGREDWKSRYYRTKAGLDYLHRFEKTELKIAGNFESDVFSYHDYESMVTGNTFYWSPGRQHHTKASAGIGLTSSHNDVPLRFDIRAEYLFFDKKYPAVSESVEDKNRENIFRVNVDLQGDISDEQVIGLKANMDNILYSFEGIKNYSTLNIKPYYLHEGDSWKAKLGVNVDLGFGYGKNFLVSPDVEGAYNFAEDYSVYLNLKGGRILNDYRHLEQLSPYYLPSPYYFQDYFQRNFRSTYIPLDGTLGIKASPATGLWFNLYGGYQIRNDDVCLASDYETDFVNAYNYFKVADTKAFYIGGIIDYTYKDRFKFSFNTTYYSWTANDEIALLFKPEFQIRADMDFLIMKGLFFNIGYDYSKRPEVRTYTVDSFSSIELTSGMHRMAAINNLNAKVSYYFIENLSVFVKGDNLLNKEYEYYYSYPAQKISCMGGVAFRF